MKRRNFERMFSNEILIEYACPAWKREGFLFVSAYPWEDCKLPQGAPRLCITSCEALYLF
ncbi:MAG: hypothetical protein LBK13_02315 [Spirochaetales bacterium]|jgi:hypothetical protein|nr:hypothetical protein [Spirochaetales bacterium]